MEAHIFAFRDEKTEKVVLKIAPYLNVEDIATKLKERGLEAISLTAMRSPFGVSSSYLICFLHDTNLDKIHNIQVISKLDRKNL